MEQYKRILLKEFDSRQKVITELTNLEAILNLPKGTELYISDIHGEFEAFDYILRSCAGILNEKLRIASGILYHKMIKTDYQLWFPIQNLS